MALGTQVSPTPAPARRRDRWPPRVAVGLAVLGLGYRLLMLLIGMPATNSDEATMALAALHIAQGRELPVFFYGQHYMGALEAYLAAPLLVLAGASTVAVRLPLLLLYGVFLLVMWQLTARLYSPWFATFTTGLLALGSYRILMMQLVALGGYPEMNPAGALLLLLAVNLAQGLVRRRTAAYAGWGFVAGLMLWDDWLLLPYVGVAAMVLCSSCAHRPTRRELATLVVGVLVGAAPLLWHNLTAPWPQNSVAVFLTLNGGSSAAGLVGRLYGAVLVGVPMSTGMCGPAGCARWQLWWGWAYPVLLVAAGSLAVRGVGAARRAGSGDRELVRQAGRLALVVAAGFTVLAYLRSAPAALTPVDSSRYLSCLLISTPAVLWPLWSVLARRRWTPAVRGSAAVGLAAVLATALVATAAVPAQVPVARRAADQRGQLVTELRRQGINHFYSGYWTCGVLVFASSEELVCAALADDLRPGQDRYLPYRDRVGEADRPAYVLPSGSPVSAAVAGLLRVEDPAAGVTTVAGYDIYRPTRPVGVPRR